MWISQNPLLKERERERKKEEKEIEFQSQHEEKDLRSDKKQNDKQKSTRLASRGLFWPPTSITNTSRRHCSLLLQKQTLDLQFSCLWSSEGGPVDAHCYSWHEGEARRASTEIGSCILQYLDEVAPSSNNGNLEITFHSVNCGGKWKKKSITAAYP